VASQVGRGRCEVREGRLGLHEAKLHDAAGGVVNEDQEGASRAAAFEPVVVAAVDLNELAHAFPPMPWLVRSGDSLVARQPNASLAQNLANRLLRQLDAVALEQLLPDQGRAEVFIGGSDQVHDASLQGVVEPTVAHASALARNQPLGTVLLVRNAKPRHLAYAKAQDLGCLHLFQVSFDHLADDAQTVDLPRTHQDQLSGHRCLRCF
jgi:hypothetical protein